MTIVNTAHTCAKYVLHSCDQFPTSLSTLETGVRTALGQLDAKVKRQHGFTIAIGIEDIKLRPPSMSITRQRLRERPHCSTHCYSCFHSMNPIYIRPFLAGLGLSGIDAAGVGGLVRTGFQCSGIGNSARRALPIFVFRAPSAFSTVFLMALLHARISSGSKAE